MGNTTIGKGNFMKKFLPLWCLLLMSSGYADVVEPPPFSVDSPVFLVFLLICLLLSTIILVPYFIAYFIAFVIKLLLQFFIKSKQKREKLNTYFKLNYVMIGFLVYFWVVIITLTIDWIRGMRCGFSFVHDLVHNSDLLQNLLYEHFVWSLLLFALLTFIFVFYVIRFVIKFLLQFIIKPTQKRAKFDKLACFFKFEYLIFGFLVCLFVVMILVTIVIITMPQQKQIDERKPIEIYPGHPIEIYPLPGEKGNKWWTGEGSAGTQPDEE